VHIHGFHPIREALRHRPHEVVQVWIGAGRKGNRRREIESLCQRHGVECRTVGEEKLRALTEGVHNGFVAEVKRAERVEQAHGDPDLVVLLEDIQDPRNLGAILRVCEGAGVGRVLVRDRGTAPLTATVAKTSAGATEWLEVERITNTSNTLHELKEEGFWVYGADAEGDLPWETGLTGKVVICLGGEEKGLRKLTRELCDGLVGLPMRGRVESLNVSAAASALLYEAVRQRTGS
jgi:23S rRNA (guanosine2251-2'-O)-methyltransferase